MLKIRDAATMTRLANAAGQDSVSNQTGTPEPESTGLVGSPSHLRAINRALGLRDNEEADYACEEIERREGRAVRLADAVYRAHGALMNGDDRMAFAAVRNSLEEASDLIRQLSSTTASETAFTTLVKCGYCMRNINRYRTEHGTFCCPGCADMAARAPVAP